MKIWLVPTAGLRGLEHFQMISIGEIRLEASTIKRIHKNTFRGTKVGTIEFWNCRIGVIEAKSFSEMVRF